MHTFKSADLGYQRPHILHWEPIYEALAPDEGAIINHAMHPALPQH